MTKELKRTERGWAGHFICANSCKYCKWSDSESKFVHPPCKDCNWDLDKWEIKENDSKAKS